ncbi:MAG: UDP-2,3-diacylglucosamine diphosphatase [Pseudomonadota bacterium]
MNPAVPPLTARTVVPPWGVLQAPTHWQMLDFISDLHLQASEPATFSAWQNFMQTTRADAVFILGDLFEVWVGDDVLDSDTDSPALALGFEAQCAQVIKAASRRLSVYFINGNRDFLLGPSFAQVCGMTLLDDPTVLDFAGQRWLLSHGDALCLDDTDYLQFRAQVRSLSWQQAFLAKPLIERQAIARALRTQSETHKRSGATYADVDAQAACDWLRAAQASTLIHGHTHRPADHDLPCSLASDSTKNLRRIVLSDWDATATPARGEVLRLSRGLPDQSMNTPPQRLALTRAASS